MLFSNVYEDIVMKDWNWLTGSKTVAAAAAAVLYVASKLIKTIMTDIIFCALGHCDLFKIILFSLKG